MEPIKVDASPTQRSGQWEDSRGRLRDVCQLHPKALAVNQCVDCVNRFCHTCIVFDGSQPLCRNCSKKRQKAARLRFAMKSLLAILVIGGGGAALWHIQAGYVPPFDYGEWKYK